MSGLRARRALAAAERVVSGLVDYFRLNDPTFRWAIGPALVLSSLLFVRSPYTNYIFDEQEALLANPYVNGNDLGFFQVLERDFWGLPPDRSIGSYRPIPNVLWRLIWKSHVRMQHPWVHHLLNVILHGVNAALSSAFASRLGLGRRGSWFVGAVFVTSAVLTEAVAGVVGLADVLGGLGVLLALFALASPLWAMPVLVFLAVSLGFFSKESTLVALPLVGWVALATAPLLHSRPLRLLRAVLAFAAALAALVFYTEVRRAFFPVVVPPPAEVPTDDVLVRTFHQFLLWFSQPKLPADPINNPLVDAAIQNRIASGAAVYARGLLQVVFPWKLSGDYSYAAEVIPERLYTVASVLGGMLLLLPPLVGVAVLGLAWREETRSARTVSMDRTASRVSPRAAVLVFVAIALLWVPVAYFPHSNIPILLPTVRAERFWYLPVIGCAFGLAVLLDALCRWGFRNAGLGAVLVIAFFGFQAGRARAHALDYSNDLVFWRATARAVPDSAKGHLNYGVMLGARGRLEERLVENRRAMEIAPRWPMAHIYYADTLCRLHRADEAWPRYVTGFKMAPNDRNLIALAMQCLWDEKAVDRHRHELLDLAEGARGTWLAYLSRDMVYNGVKHSGVDPQYRPRSYDGGPKSR
jgi:hypothetical protein